MELNVQDWKEFRLNKVFSLKGGFYNKKPEHSVVGTIPFLASTENNNGVTEYYSLNDIISWDKVGEPDNTLENKLFSGNSIAVTVNGSVCNAFYQKTQFTCSHDITQLCLRHHTMNEYIGQFLCVVIMMDKYRWNYGRKPHDVKKFGMSIIRLPIIHNSNETPFIDESRTFSDEGYVPDWQFMEDYIKSLHHKPITTKVKSGIVKKLDVANWEEFTINNLFDIYTGGDLVISELEVGSIPVASNSCENNNIAFCTTKIHGRKLFNHKISISIADRGCFHAFIQPKDFYIATRVKALVIKDTIKITLKQLCFIVSVINQESFKFSYGRNCCANLPYIKIKLPIKHNSNGCPAIDKNRTYSDNGYIPDWQFMEDYINSLPYSDRI